MVALERIVTADVAALMVTNPNTLGVFEENIVQAAEILHAKGAMLYMDGANMNALVGIARPGDFGADVRAPEPGQDVLDSARRRRAGRRPVAVKKALEPFLPMPRLKRSGKEVGLGLQTQAFHWARVPRVLWQFRSAGPRAGLHPGARRTRPAQCHRRRGSQRQLHSQAAGAILRSALFLAQHARGGVQPLPPGTNTGVRPATSPSG